MKENKQELLRLLGSICNETIAADQVVRLNQLLRESPTARQLYADYLEVQMSLVQGVRRELPFTCEETSELAETITAQEVLGQVAEIASEQRRSAGPGSYRKSLKYLMANAALLAVSAAGLWWVARAPSVAEQNIAARQNDVKEISNVDSQDSPMDSNKTTEPLFVAQVSNLTDDVVWGDRSTDREFLLRLRRGDRLDIATGLVQLDYYTGAKIVLRGPCLFVPTSANSGRLERGHLTGEVSEGDFLLTTPTAKVIDLGTAFGVSVDDVTRTDVCVFDGEVQVISDQQGESSSNSLLLEEGMAARVHRGHGIEALANLDVSQFVRYLPTPSASLATHAELSLVDVLSGHDGQSYRLAGVIAADTGESDQHPWLRPDGPGYSMSTGYQQTAWHPFVSGVFIPSASGSKTLLDPAGHIVDLPASTGRTWGPIWSRRQAAGAMAVGSSEDYWGTDSLEDVIARMEQCETGMIGIHSNVGVTFDLEAIRKQTNQQLLGFHSTLINLDNSLKRKHDPGPDSEYGKLLAAGLFSADFRLYVDGELRASKLGFKRSDGELTIQAELSPSDRFLTLVSTDAGGHSTDAHDHVLLIDPVITLLK